MSWWLLLLISLGALASRTSAAEGYYYKEVYPPVDMSQEDLSRGHLFFALVLSFGGQVNSSGNIAGIQVALDRINNDPNILPNHTLHYTLTDSMARSWKECLPVQCHIFPFSHFPFACSAIGR